LESLKYTEDALCAVLDLVDIDSILAILSESISKASPIDYRHSTDCCISKIIFISNAANIRRGLRCFNDAEIREVLSAELENNGYSTIIVRVCLRPCVLWSGIMMITVTR
jgi:hypothetical protein